MTEFRKRTKGIIAGNFDVIHPGYIDMFNEMESLCDEVIVLLQTDPSIERPTKLKPILSVNDRIKILSSLKQITSIQTYTYESELYDLIKLILPSVRFLGDDYIGRTDFTGYDLNIPIHYLNRSHGWSTTKFKKLIAESL
jgi:glycerol-3-phosphate cytidylyltransferase